MYVSNLISNKQIATFCIFNISHSKHNFEFSIDIKCIVLWNFQGFVHVRIWFPQFPGVVMQSDQELIIMCKPPEPTVIQNKAAGFAGSFPGGARVSGENK